MGFFSYYYRLSYLIVWRLENEILLMTLSAEWVDVKMFPLSRTGVYKTTRQNYYKM